MGVPTKSTNGTLVRSVRRGEVVTGEEIHFIRNDGSSGIMLVNAAPIRDRHNQIKAGVVTFYDISDRQQMEAAPRDREHRFSTLFNGMEDWVLVYHLSPEGTPSQLIEVNEQACHKLGYSREELLQMSVTEIIDSTSVTPLVTLEKLKSEKHVVIESVHRTKAGQCIPVEVSATLFTLNGLPTVQSICRDITERKRAEAEREQLWEWERQARAQAEDANRIKDEFLAVLSHELRSPLNPILGWVRLLRSRQFDSATTDKALEIIERNTKLQAQLIEDLLDVSRILQGKMLLNVIALNMIVPLEGALETVRLAAEAKAIALETHLEAGEVLGDPMRLQQAMWNLLSNAIKFTPPGGRIEVRLQTIGDELQIQIKDSGKGIAPAFVPHVFEYFRQEDGSTTRQFGGLGLGLAIVRHLVELHGGRIYAESAGEGLGATFTVRLPRLLSQPPADSAGEVRVVPWRDSCENLAPLAGLRVLVVDDEPDMRDLLGVVLQQWGAEVQVAASAREALGLISRLPFDLVISDIGMPEMDGYQLMRQLRSRLPEQGSQVKAIALTAYAGEWNQQQALAAGFHKHLAKPVTPEVLLEAIATLLED
uniref:ATP-binding protein n=1 Tax=Desertifilum tharense IPPAS B-1220 TaxID=1781255 RepID=A0ACD5GW74_9CYAN